MKRTAGLEIPPRARKRDIFGNDLGDIDAAEDLVKDALVNQSRHSRMKVMIMLCVPAEPAETGTGYDRERFYFFDRVQKQVHSQRVG